MTRITHVYFGSDQGRIRFCREEELSPEVVYLASRGDHGVRGLHYAPTCVIEEGYGPLSARQRDTMEVLQMLEAIYGEVRR